jgi:hypothetical protein
VRTPSRLVHDVLILVSNASSARSPWIEVRGHRVATASPEARPSW